MSVLYLTLSKFLSLDQESVTSEDVDRAPGYPNMVFKTGKLQDAFHAYKQRFIRVQHFYNLCPAF